MLQHAEDPRLQDVAAGDDEVGWSGAHLGLLDHAGDVEHVALTVDLDAGLASSSSIGTDTLVSFERLLTGSGNDVITGTATTVLIGSGLGDDTITGSDGDTTIYAGGGNDTVNAGAGNAIIFGGYGADTLNGDAGDDFISAGPGLFWDTLDGGDGFDTLDMSDASVAVKVNLSAGYSLGRGVDTISNFERVVTGSGNDVVIASSGNETLEGGAGNDTIIGWAGFDTLEGGSGDDVLTGGFNADTFVFADGFGNDTITDFEALNNFERIDLRDVTAITSFADLQASHLSQSGANAVIADGAGNTITLAGVNIADLDANDFVF